MTDSGPLEPSAERTPIAQPASPTPPTTPPPYAPPPTRSTWPTVLGIIAIILGVMGILGAFGQIVYAMMRSAIKLPPGQGPDWTTMQPPVPWLVVSCILSLAMGILVLGGGIGLTQRRRWSVPSIRIWAVAHILFLVVNMIVTYTSLAGALQKVQQDAATTGAPPQAMMAGMVAGMCGGVLFGISPPIFALIWFARRKIKDEVVTWA